MTVGVLNRRKNIHWLIEQWIENDSFGTDCLLLAIGPQGREDPNGEIIGSLKELADKSPSKVQILEEVDDIERYYRAADIFILPSHGEGMPNVLLEAMASGLPCIATRVSGVTDLAREGETAYTFIPNDTEGLRKALLAVLADSDGLLGQRGRLLVENEFGLSVLAERYESLYNEITINTSE